MEHESHEQEEKSPELTESELDAEAGEVLPEREAMSVVDPSAGTLPGPDPWITLPVEPPATE